MNWNKKNLLAIVVAILIVVAIGKITSILNPPHKSSITASIVEPEETIRMKVSAYCPCKKCCGKYADGKTSINRDAWKTLGVAADPKMLSYGTKVEIPEIGIREVDDTGGAMRQSAKKRIYHIDIRFHDHNKAKEFGVQWLNVKIL